jgi:S-adenosylmethionine:diacylglycerol 3-amino-3-carboxypropyl transferase
LNFNMVLETCLNKEREARLRFDFFLLTNYVLWMFFFARTKQQQ